MVEWRRIAMKTKSTEKQYDTLGLALPSASECLTLPADELLSRL